MPTGSEPLIEQVKIQDALLKRRAERSLRAYIEEAWPILEPDVVFLPNWHIDLVVEHLEAVTAGQIPRLLINVPPRSGKSLVVSIFWPTWEWIWRPGGRRIFVSYAAALPPPERMCDHRPGRPMSWAFDR